MGYAAFQCVLFLLFAVLAGIKGETTSNFGIVVGMGLEKKFHHSEALARLKL